MDRECKATQERFGRDSTLKLAPVPPRPNEPLGVIRRTSSAADSSASAFWTLLPACVHSGSCARRSDRLHSSEYAFGYSGPLHLEAIGSIAHTGEEGNLVSAAGQLRRGRCGPGSSGFSQSRRRGERRGSPLSRSNASKTATAGSAAAAAPAPDRLGSHRDFSRIVGRNGAGARQAGGCAHGDPNGVRTRVFTLKG